MSEQSVGRTAPERRADGASTRRRGIVFILNRLTGLGVLLYLSFHLVVLSLLARGPSAWDGFVSLAGSPLFLCFDVVLIFGLLFHGLNGIRVTLVGFGLVVDRQRAMLVALMVIGAIVLLIASVHILTVG
jgi:succinate dehydrogenase / fumarate reductase cytochrome b subunit